MPAYLPAPIFSDWSPLHRGISHAVGYSDLAFDLMGVARRQSVNAIRVDLHDPEIGFVIQHYSVPQYSSGQYILDFMQGNPAVEVAINSNFSWSTTGILQPGVEYKLFGLAASGGRIACNPTQDDNVPDPRYAGAQALIIGPYRPGNTPPRATSFPVVTVGHPPMVEVDAAVAGSPQPVRGSVEPQKHVGGPLMLVRGGENCAEPSATPSEKIAGRTAAGVSADQRYLYLVTVDGNENAPLPYGAAFRDIAAWLLIAGASNGVNLDGGGSTCMARRDPAAGPLLMNVPYGDEGLPMVQRSVGLFFGVSAGPTPVVARAG